MPDLSSSLLPNLTCQSISGVDINNQFILPKYDDQSILNIPPTICKWMGLPTFGADSLKKEITNTFENNIRKVILILMDGLSYQRFQKWQSESPVWKPIIDNGLLAPLSSVVPSTTSSSLTTLWTARSPASHGIIGYEMWLKEYALVANMILHTPMTFTDEAPGSLKKAGFSPDAFLRLPTLGTHLRHHGCKPYSFTHHSIANSGLSQMLMRDVEVFPFQTPASLWVSVRNLIEKKPADKIFIWAYWGQLDGISHYHGPDDERAKAEFSHFSMAFERYFFSPLPIQARQDTLIILTSDHGQTHTPLEKNYTLKHHPELNQYLRLKPTCENRFAFLYLRPGFEEKVRDYFNKIFPDRITLISHDEALQAGLFGPGSNHPELIHRIGDLIAIAHDDAYLWWSDQEDFLLGRHGGLGPDDMIVPFVAGRL